MNCGPGSNDNQNDIKKNLKIVKNKIGKNTKDIFLLHQVHSNKFIYVKKDFKFKRKKIKADAIITDQKKFPIGILTADCAPVFLYDEKRNMIAAIHAGWKGAFKGIIDKVINFMLNKGCKKKHLIAVIGPSIKQSNYNVGEDLKRKFVKKNKNNLKFFNKKKGLNYFDLPNFIKSQLKSKKITKIDMINIDTFDERNNFFSARRSIRLNHNDYGRNISIIMIN